MGGAPGARDQMAKEAQLQQGQQEMMAEVQRKRDMRTAQRDKVAGQQAQSKQQMALARYLHANGDTDMAQLALQGVVTPQNYKNFKNSGQSERYAVVGNNVFDRETKQFISPEKAQEERKGGLTDKQRADLQKDFTAESVNAYAKDPSATLVPKKEPEGKEKGTEHVMGELASIDALMGTLDEAEKAARDSVAGTYDIAKFIPLTDARNLKGLIATIDSNLAFDRLQKMRDESKTGGALGQVSNIELELLRSSVENLDPGAGDKEFIRRLNNIRSHYNRFKSSLLGELPNDQFMEVGGKSYYKRLDGTWVELPKESNE